MGFLIKARATKSSKGLTHGLLAWFVHSHQKHDEGVRGAKKYLGSGKKSVGVKEVVLNKVPNDALE